MNMTGQVSRPARWRLGLVTGIAASLALVVAAATRAEDAPEAEAPPSGTPSAPAGAQPSTPTVRIVFKIIPNGNATVMWGKKRLGVIKPRAPLVVQRPRDSGPLDVIIRSPGYILVHSRAYTFTDTTVAVKLTPIDKKNTLYGYREEIPPDADGGTPSGPDGGMP